MAKLFTNNAQTTLSAAITTTGQTSITVTDGSVFPSPVSPDYFIATITQAGTSETSWEEVKVTARSGNTLTIVRGQEGSSAATWASADKVEIRWTAESAGIASNTGERGVALLDFGDAPGSNLATVTIFGQTEILASSQCQAWMMASNTTDHNETEHSIADIKLTCGNVQAGQGFDIVGFSSERLTGLWEIQWIRT